MKMGFDVNKVLRIEDLARGDEVIFAAAGMTDGELLRGVQFKSTYAETQSVIMQEKSGTFR